MVEEHNKAYRSLNDGVRNYRKVLTRSERAEFDELEKHVRRTQLRVVKLNVPILKLWKSEDQTQTLDQATVNKFLLEFRPMLLQLEGKTKDFLDTIDPEDE